MTKTRKERLDRYNPPPTKEQPPPAQVTIPGLGTFTRQEKVKNKARR